MNEIIKNFKGKLEKGGCVYGPFMKTADSMFVEAAGIAGFDFAILDMEHGPVSLENQQSNVRGALVRKIAPIIRVKDANENTIGSALDIGALGVQVPQVKTAEQARQVVRNAKFYPYGMRGVCRFVRAAEYSSMEKKEYFEASQDLIIIVQLEGVEAVENMDEILDVEGVDILFVGPYDLSQSLGIPGEVDNPIVIDMMKKIVKRAKDRGKIVGTFVDDMRMLKLWREVGVQYLSYNVDVGIFMDACKEILHKMNQ